MMALVLMLTLAPVSRAVPTEVSVTVLMAGSFILALWPAPQFSDDCWRQCECSPSRLRRNTER